VKNLLFTDSPHIGIDWAGKWIQLGVGSTGRKDNRGITMSLPKGSIGYVFSATPGGTLLVVFGNNPMIAPEKPSQGVGVSDRRYKYVCNFNYDDWLALKIKVSA
jgi:hypothetical protein